MNNLYIILFLNELELICLHTSITIIFIQLNGSKYSNTNSSIFLFSINHLFEQT